jgi:hypothetical protein
VFKAHALLKLTEEECEGSGYMWGPVYVVCVCLVECAAALTHAVLCCAVFDQEAEASTAQHFALHPGVSSYGRTECLRPGHMHSRSQW